MMPLVFAFAVFWVAVAATEADRGAVRTRRELPDNLVVGYASWSECDDKIITAVEDGVNVLIWFAINLAVNETTGEPTITGGPDLECVKEVKHLLVEKDLPTTHLISIGGWDAPHPDTSNPPDAVFQSWVDWNKEIFDGFDWDVEGNDELKNPNNVLTMECMHLMGTMSQLGKRAGFVVSMAPAESYMDPTTSRFDHILLHTYPEWEELEPDFHYHGHNSYAFIYSKYGLLGDGSHTFDFVSIQLYEGYSHALYNISIEKVSPSAYLESYVPFVVNGWSIDSPAIDPSTMQIKIPANRLVIGLANGWADNSKFLLVWPEELIGGYEALKRAGIQPRGFMFWDIADEGLSAVASKGDERPFWMARGLNSFLHTRPRR